MSWLFSLALVEEYSEAIYSDGEQSAPLSVMPTQHKFWRNDKMMEFSSLSQFGLTCAVLTEGRGKELLMSFLADFPARTSPLPGEEKESKAKEVGSGVKWCVSFAKYDHDSSSWRTHQFLLLGGLGEYSETWPRWGLMRTGECWERTTSALTMLERGSGLLPTLTVCGNYNRKGASPTSGDGLITAIKKLPTLLRRDCRTVKGGARSVNALGSEPLITQIAEIEGREDGRLNPEWAEWFMGFPMGWTELQPLEMHKFQLWQQQHSEPSLAIGE